MPENDKRLLLLHEQDNVLVLRASIAASEEIMLSGQKVHVDESIDLGHKLARRKIGKGEKVIKYGVSIGSATCDIALGAHVHLSNLKSDYTASNSLDEARVAHARHAETGAQKQ